MCWTCYLALDVLQCALVHKVLHLIPRTAWQSSSEACACLLIRPGELAFGVVVPAHGDSSLIELSQSVHLTFRENNGWGGRDPPSCAPMSLPAVFAGRFFIHLSVSNLISTTVLKRIDILSIVVIWSSNHICCLSPCTVVDSGWSLFLRKKDNIWRPEAKLGKY